MPSERPDDGVDGHAHSHVPRPGLSPEPVRPRVRVYRDRPGFWVITNGISVAITSTAESAWALLTDRDHAPNPAAQ